MKNTEKVTAAIDLLVARITATVSVEEALKFTQAALNLAHTAALLDNIKR